MTWLSTHGKDILRPVSFLSELATNSSKHGIPWTFLSAQGDALSGPMPTLSEEPSTSPSLSSVWYTSNLTVVIQNTTFGGIRGFTQAPSTAWYGPNGGVAGVVHQERNVTFILFQEAGDQIPIWQPRNVSPSSDKKYVPNGKLLHLVYWRIAWICVRSESQWQPWYPWQSYRYAVRTQSSFEHSRWKWCYFHWFGGNARIYGMADCYNCVVE